jgi:hypothetical protein
MKSKKRERVNRLKNDLAWLDPDQEMVHEEDEIAYRKPETFKESLSRGFRSFLAIVICLVIPALWYFDWNTSAFADKTSETVSGIFESGVGAGSGQDGIAPLPPAPDIPGAASFDGSMIDYTSALKEAGLLESFSSPAIRAFYENGVTIDYLTSLNDAGMIGNLSFPAITSFFQNEVPLEYLNRLEEENLLDKLSFPAVIAFHQNSVSMEYLMKFNESGYLDGLSFPAVVAYFENDVTVDFLNELKERDLLEDLSFPAVVDMYNNQ